LAVDFFHKRSKKGPLVNLGSYKVYESYKV